MKEKSKILIIDDEEIICDLLNRIFCETDYICLTAGDGLGGLAIFAREHPDLVIVDKRLPGMDGLLVLKKIREKNSGVPVIIMSGYDDPEMMNASVRYNAFDFFSKPFDFAKLRETVVMALAQARKV